MVQRSGMRAYVTEMTDTEAIIMAILPNGKIYRFIFAENDSNPNELVIEVTTPSALLNQCNSNAAVIRDTK
jgi:hypothetical protein